MTNNLPERDKNKHGLFTTLMIVIGSMIGAGILVVPNQIMPYGFAGILGWVLASLCSLALARIFATMSVSNIDEAKGGSLSAIVRAQYGDKSGFLVGWSHWVFGCIGSAVVTITFVKYLSTICSIDSNMTKFLISSSIIIAFTLMHSITRFGLKLISSITSFKLFVFALVALCGIFFFDQNKVFGIICNPSDNIISNAYKGFISSGGSLWDSILLVFTSASLALLAFAGLESAVSSSESVQNPKKTIPQATLLGVAISGFIFICTHICVVNALGSTIEAAPVRKAVGILLSRCFGENIGNIAGIIVFVGAVFGCLGTVLAMIFVYGNVLYDTLLIGNEGVTKICRRTHTGFPAFIGSVSSTFTIIFIYLNYFVITDLSLILSAANFLLIYAYFQCTLINLQKSKNIILSLTGILSCLMLFVGCNKSSVFAGIAVLFVGDILYSLLSKYSKKHTKHIDS